ncbi:C40 family peptidase [Natronincola ferrireducens]|uniref:Cell wall-associated hydrolase, NlpC family n=1 Tax=Natronincola ferrireducens TaxID=393762 RepID=A0A1G9D5A0_9FIRM|nr:C40 family peptidase [Natronincola ferrireducens]SDK59051.1 Cell wall-associated hydrolase, NlpC family [Natronincola ferrireducens]
MTKLKTRNLQMLIVILMFSLLSTSFAAAENPSATIIASQGILRKSPDFAGKITETLKIGTEVSIHKQQEDWYFVKLEDNSTEGWMYKDIVLLNDKKNTIKKGVTTASILNVRSGPSTNNSIISKVPNGTETIIIQEEKEWYQVQLNNGVKGFVNANYVKLVPNYPQAIVLNDDSSVRAEASSGAPITITLNKNHTIYIKDYKDGWYHILTEDFTEGWIKSDMIELQINVSTQVSRSGSRTNTLSNIKSITEKYIGRPYRYAGNGPNSFDCSGFTYYIFNTYYKEYLQQKGINLPRTSRSQANVGTQVSRNQLQIGDLVFFNNGSSKTINHVGIYVGNNEFIHASSGGNMRVIISSLNENTYKNRYSTAVRL